MDGLFPARRPEMVARNDDAFFLYRWHDGVGCDAASVVRPAACAREKPDSCRRSLVEVNATNRRWPTRPERVLEGHPRHEARRQHREGSARLEAAAHAGGGGGVATQPDP